MCRRVCVCVGVCVGVCRTVGVCVSIYLASLATADFDLHFLTHCTVSQAASNATQRL